MLNHQSFSGVVVALHGKETSAGNFLVEDVLEAGLPPQTALSSAGNILHIAMCSYFNIFSQIFNDDRIALKLHLLWLQQKTSMWYSYLG
jgi:hypothetical protein